VWKRSEIAYTATVLHRPNLLASANSFLAPYAVPHGPGLGRVYPEHEDSTRLPFQRDRDRIIHSQAFRRLSQKTQVFVAGHGDHYRTRITHTLEVAQISRDIARSLRLNEDLAEAIALAHDLGHTPFGHAGEEAMRQCMEEYGSTFEHNQQSLRIVTILERRSAAYSGLNLRREVLEGLMKHRTPHDHPGHSDIPRSPTLEAQVVNLADEIAYTAHDTDDGIRAGLFTMRDVARTALGSRAASLSRKSGTEIRGEIIHLLVTDLDASATRTIRTMRIRSLADVYRMEHAVIDFSAAMHRELSELREFLWKKLYLSSQVQRQARRGKRTIKTLVAAYLRHPPRKVLDLRRTNKSSLPEAVKDFVAGMTDGYAMREDEKMRS
jgi:dGTPase